MSDHDPTLGADHSKDGLPPTELPPTDPAPSLDSLQTQLPAGDPEIRLEPGRLAPYQGSTDTYATAHPDAAPTPDREVPLDVFPGYELEAIREATPVLVVDI